MKTIRILSFLYILTLTSCFQGSAPQHDGKDSTTTQHADTLKKGTAEVADSSKAESLVMDKVMALPEMQAYVKRVDSIFKGNNHVSMDVVSAPTKEQNYYTVRVGFSDSVQFHVEYTFCVSPGTYTIKVYDAVRDSVISLADWRKSMK